MNAVLRNPSPAFLREKAARGALKLHAEALEMLAMAVELADSHAMQTLAHFADAKFPEGRGILWSKRARFACYQQNLDGALTYLAARERLEDHGEWVRVKE